MTDVTRQDVLAQLERVLSETRQAGLLKSYDVKVEAKTDDTVTVTLSVLPFSAEHAALLRSVGFGEVD